MSDDPWGSMFDFNGDGHTDAGEQWTGYQIYKDCTGQSSGNSAPSGRGRRLNVFEIVIIVLFVWQALTWICGALYD